MRQSAITLQLDRKKIVGLIDEHMTRPDIDDLRPQPSWQAGSG